MIAQRIYLVRHGETVWNRENRVQGHLDSDLTPKGEAQALAAGRTLARLLDGEMPYRMRVSPLGRAQRSAALILESLRSRIRDVQDDPEVIEISWGRWEGMTRPEISVRDPENWARRQADRWHVPPPSGESHAALAARAARWLEAVRHEPRLVVVSHGAFGATLRGVYQGLAPETFATLEKPQDAVFCLEGGTVTEIPTHPEV